MAPVARARRGRGRSIGLLASVVLLCACFWACALAAGIGLIRAVAAMPEIGDVLDQYMAAMRDERVADAYSLITAGAQQVETLEEFAARREGNAMPPLAGYRSLELTGFNAIYGSSPYEAAGAGRTGPEMTVTGSVFYEGGYAGGLQAVMLQENGTWRIADIGINVPLEMVPY